jgi:hypothetical protein
MATCKCSFRVLFLGGGDNATRCHALIDATADFLLLMHQIKLTRTSHADVCDSSFYVYRYYFSWAGFVTSILLLVNYLRGVFGVDLVGEVKNRSARLTLWAAFLAGQLVVMGASANIFDKDCASGTSDVSSAYCSRTKFGISVGAVGTAFALVVVGMKMMTSIAPFVVEGVLALFLCILNGFGVAFITSAEGPGSPIGNLYYFVSVDGCF